MPSPIRKAALFLGILAAVYLFDCYRGWTSAVFANGAENLAPFATPSTSYVSGHETLDAINSGYEPRAIDDHSHGGYGNWPRTGEQWVEYRWSKPISTREVMVYWWQDGLGIKLPVSAKLLSWNGSDYVAVQGTVGVRGGAYSVADFPEITTDRLRLAFTSDGNYSTGLLQWKVIDSGKSPTFPPTVDAGNDRVVFLPATAPLEGKVRGMVSKTSWAKVSGPGTVTFQDAAKARTSAAFSQPGAYRLRFTAGNAGGEGSAEIGVTVQTMPSGHLDPVFTTHYSIDSPLWSDRVKQVIVHWIPHLIDELSKTDLPEGGIENFVQAGNAVAGRPYQPHMGSPWSDAYTHNAVESMCVALEIDPKGDPEIIAAQKRIRATLDQWIPIILAAQEPDGYLQTRIILGQPNEYPNKPRRWTMHGEHEGYASGYFIDSAIAHYLMTGGKDRRMYDAAKRLADCWDKNIGPAPKQRWYDGHEEIEQSLVSLARLIDQVEGAGKGDRYIALAKFLLSCRGEKEGGADYDQTQAPVVDQYYAAGHAVRATYLYSAMTDIAMETNDPAYHTAVNSIWQDMINRKYYVTGGVGSGETSEGFGKAYSLPNSAYCESCSGCGEIYFQHKMNLAYADARYIDLLETTLYNAVLSDIDLTGRNFTYTNPLDTSDPRYPWHPCPCCTGNIPRTLLELPSWMYATGQDALYVNLFIGSTVNLEVSGKPVEIKQVTDYPRTGHVELQVNPGAVRHFALYVRAPDRNTSQLYASDPQVSGMLSLAVNGKRIDATPSRGYVRIERDWSPGDKVAFDLPMTIQRIHADSRIAADRGRVALQYGPLVYTIESADQALGAALPATSALTVAWEPDLLRGVTAIHGSYADGSQMTAIPYYARNNRGGRSMVWIGEK